MASMAGARQTFGPAESYYLKTIEGASQFFCDCGEPLPHWCVFRLQDGPQPPSPDTPRRPVPLEPRRNYTGALRFRTSHLEALPLSLEIPVLTLTFARVHSYGSEGRSCARLCPYPTQQPLLMGVGGKLH
jgi:hypothetical protein